MVRDTRRSTRRPSLLGAVKWLPLLALSFLVLFGETRLHVETLNNDYAIGQLRSEIRQTRERLESVRTEQLGLQTMDRIDSAAPMLGLVKPQSNQIQTVRCQTLEGRLRPVAGEYALARLQPTAPAGLAEIEPLD